MVHAPWRHGEYGNYNGPKVGRPVRARALPLSGAILAVQLAICWEPRVSGGTRSCHTGKVGDDLSSDNPSGAGNQQERPTI